MPVNSSSLSGTKGIGICPTQGASTWQDHRSPVFDGLQFRGKYTECLLGSNTRMCHLLCPLLPWLSARAASQVSCVKYLCALLA